LSQRNKEEKTEFINFVFSFGYNFLVNLKKIGRGMMFSIRSIMILWSLINAQMIYRDPFSISPQKTFMKIMLI